MREMLSDKLKKEWSRQWQEAVKLIKINFLKIN